MAEARIRVGLNLTIEAAEALEELAGFYEIPKTQIINKLLVDHMKWVKKNLAKEYQWKHEKNNQ